MSSESSQDTTLELINQVLDFIRGNLANIERTWGVNSTQYATTRDIMQKYWDANAQTLKQRQMENGSESNGIDLDAKLEDLLAGLSISPSSSGRDGTESKKVDGSGDDAMMS